MADPTKSLPILTEPAPPVVRRPPGRLPRWRPWVQTAFLTLWLAPWTLGNRALQLLNVPGCVFHCYGCPLAMTACPIGVMAQFSALHIVPLLAMGVVVMVGALVGSLVCGWACPFGFIQDLLAKAPLPKVRLPAWAGYGRYLMLLGLVFVGPYVVGALYEADTINLDPDAHALICKVCPAGALEAAVPARVKQALAGQAVDIPALKTTILVVFLAASMVAFRPWCTLLCPLGGIFALFNRRSVFHLRFNGYSCTECNRCRSRCACGVKVEQRVNTAGCIRCLECTTCGAITPSIGRG